MTDPASIGPASTDPTAAEPATTDTATTDTARADSSSADPSSADPSSADPVTIVYWRPGCGFCTRLLRDLDELGLPHERVNIYGGDGGEEGAAFVRSVAEGNETVPTVRVGDVALVNPTRDDVVLEVVEVAPEQVPDDWQPKPPGPVTRTLRRLLRA